MRIVENRQYFECVFAQYVFIYGHSINDGLEIFKLTCRKKSRLLADGRTMGNNRANICTVCASASYNMPCGQFDNVIFNERNCIVSHFDVTTVIAISRSDVYLLMLSHYQPTAAFFVCLQFCFLLSNRMLSHSGSAVNNRNVAFMICNLSQTQSGESVADGESRKKNTMARK